MALIKSETVTAKNKAGGKGEIYITHLLTQKEMVGQCGMFAKVVVPPGSSLGVHSHNGNTETYHILQGKALYTDNNENYEVKPGNTTFCADGDSHGIENIGDEDLIFIALIINSPK
ncbi:MAG: cupin domain-containing protein [Selenomonadaceae bacterium]|nr:cupin domain-containing protein [Selenomonadaceae bacterium]